MQEINEFKYLKFASLDKTVFWDFDTLYNKDVIHSTFPIVKLSEIIVQRKGFITIDDNEIYRRCRVQIQGKGVVLRDEIIGKEIKTKKQQVCKTDDFLVAEIDAKVGGFGIVSQELQNSIVSGHYFLFEINKNLLLPEFLAKLVKHDGFLKQVKSTGSTNYSAIRPYHVLGYKIPLPTLKDQETLISNYNAKIKEANLLKKRASELEEEIEDFLFESLGISKKSLNVSKNRSLQLIDFNVVREWGLDKILSSSVKASTKFSLVSIEANPLLAKALFRGKSPRYKKGTNAFILNQKCNRWNSLDLSFVKSVDEDWLKSIDIDNFTKEGDVLINSTGEGTIGRATYIKKEYEGLLYDSHLLLLRFDNKKVNAKLFVDIFNSQYGQDQVNDIKSAQATKQTELGISNLSRIQFPLPDELNIQNDIASNISNLKGKIEQSRMNSVNFKLEAELEFETAIFS